MQGWYQRFTRGWAGGTLSNQNQLEHKARAMLARSGMKVLRFEQITPLVVEFRVPIGSQITYKILQDIATEFSTKEIDFGNEFGYYGSHNDIITIYKPIFKE